MLTKLFIVGLAVLGALYVLPQFFGSLNSVAVSVAGMVFTWKFVVALAVFLLGTFGLSASK